jgi:hypothetical protein
MILQGNVARMALEKDGSKLVENCVKMIGRIHTLNLTQAQSLLRILDELINLPIYLPQFTYAFDQVFFSDLLTNKYSNYVVQTVFEYSDMPRRHLILQKVQHALNSIQDIKDTSLRHILKYLQKHQIYVKGLQLIVGSTA